MKIINCEQYSEEWWAARKGIPTASNANKLVTPKGALSATSRVFINELIADSLGLGDPPIEPTEWMIRGTELEPEARGYFTLVTGLEVEEVGFITNDKGSAGCSPDGLIYQVLGSPAAGLEIKCPKASTQIGYLLGGELPDYYKPQVHFSMAVSNISTWYFLSYYPELNPLVIKVEWDEYTDAMAKAIEQFVDNLEDARRRLWT